MQAGSVRLEQEVEIMAVKYKRILLKLSAQHPDVVCAGTVH